MLSRRLFAGCGLCAAIALTATGVAAQGAMAPGFSRTVVARSPVPGSPYDTIQVIVSIEPGTFIAMHTHPGTEAATIIEGGGVLLVQGQPDKPLGVGEGFLVTAGTAHALRNGDRATRVASTYVVERDKPLASPA